MARLIFGLVFSTFGLVAFGQVVPPDTAASAAIMSWETQEQTRDWVVAGLLGAACVAGFVTAYRLA